MRIGWGWADMKRLLAVVAYAALCSSVVAQAEMTEAQKRTVQVRYVRALTDCVAKAILADAQASQLAQGGDWIGAAKLTGPSCNALAARMMSVHDQLYGIGTGGLFFKGGYSEDLPRALSTRILPELERRAQAQRKRHAEADAEKFKLLEANAKEHMGCLNEPSPVRMRRPWRPSPWRIAVSMSKSERASEQRSSGSRRCRRKTS